MASSLAVDSVNDVVFVGGRLGYGTTNQFTSSFTVDLPALCSYNAYVAKMSLSSGIVLGVQVSGLDWSASNGCSSYERSLAATTAIVLDTSANPVAGGTIAGGSSGFWSPVSFALDSVTRVAWGTSAR